MGGACAKGPLFQNPKAEAYYIFMSTELPKIYDPSLKKTVVTPFLAGLKKELQQVPANAKLMPFVALKIPLGDKIVPLLQKGFDEVGGFDQIRLPHCDLTGAALREILNFVLNRKCVIHLDLSGNTWSLPAMDELQTVLQSPVTDLLESLSLRDIDLSDRQWRFILQRAFSAVKLSALDLRGNKIPTSFQPMIESLVQCNHMIRQVHLDSTDADFQQRLNRLCERNTIIGEIMDAVLLKCVDWNVVVEYRLKAVRKSQSTDKLVEESAAEQAKVDASRPVMCEYALAETKGTREHMEDEVILWPRLVGSGNANGLWTGLFAVFDGHGGRECSVYLSRIMGQDVQRRLQSGADGVTAIKEAIAGADTAITKAEVPNGSCVLLCLIQPHQLVVASVGDSMCIVSQVQANGNGKLVYQSKQAKPSDKEEKARIEGLGGFVTEDGRVNGVLGVSRALGDTSLRPMVSPAPYVDVIPLVPATPPARTMSNSYPGTHVLMACDGLWDVVSAKKAADYITHSGNVHSIARKMRNFASHKGSTDNITVISIYLPGHEVDPSFNAQA